jgi:membrane protease YdiL (CAAX protease family)
MPSASAILSLCGWTLLGLALLVGAGPASSIAAFMLVSDPQAPLAMASATGIRESIFLAPSIALMLLWRRRHSAPYRLGFDGGLGLGTLCGLGLAFLAITLAGFGGAIGPGAGPDARDLVSISALIVLIPALILHGCAEEIVFRGIVQEAAISLFGVRGGVVFAALGWALLQFFQGYTSPMHILNSFLVGLGFGLVTLRAGVLAAGAAHGLWTWAETRLFGFGPTASPPLFDLDVVTPNFWTGPFADTYGGFATSCAALLVLTALIWSIRTMPASGKSPARKKRTRR